MNTDEMHVMMGAADVNTHRRAAESIRNELRGLHGSSMFAPEAGLVPRNRDAKIASPHDELEARLAALAHARVDSIVRAVSFDGLMRDARARLSAELVGKNPCVFFSWRASNTRASSAAYFAVSAGDLPPVSSRDTWGPTRLEARMMFSTRMIECIENRALSEAVFSFVRDCWIHELKESWLVNGVRVYDPHEHPDRVRHPLGER